MFKKCILVLTGYKYLLKWASIRSVHISRNQCVLRYGRCSCDSYSRCSTQLLALLRTEVRTLSKFPGLTPNFWPAFSARCCNITKSQFSNEYTAQFRWPHRQYSRKWRSGNCQDLASSPRLTESLARTLSGNAEETGWCPNMDGQHVLSLWRDACSKNLVNNPPTHDGKLCLIYLLYKTNFPTIWLLKVPT
jgi:hypothetical protein